MSELTELKEEKLQAADEDFKRQLQDLFKHSNSGLSKDVLAYCIVAFKPKRKKRSK